MPCGGWRWDPIGGRSRRNAERGIPGTHSLGVGSVTSSSARPRRFYELLSGKEDPAMTTTVDKMRTTPEGYFTTRWGLPEYTDWIDESMSWKETCYIGDWSFLWEHRFRGPEVLKLFSDVSVNSFTKFAVG